MRCIRRSQVAGLLVARGSTLPRRIPLFFFYIVLLLAISACSLQGTKAAVKHATDARAATEAAAAVAASTTSSPMDTFRAMAPPEGLSFTPLFDKHLGDNDARIQRLEDAVQMIRNDLDTVVPTLTRMASVEKDIKGLVEQLQSLADGGPPVESAPVPEVTPQQLPPALADGQPIPGEDAAKGTEPAGAPTVPAGPAASSSLVTPEAASKGELPPEGAASPISKTPVDIKPQAAPPASKEAAQPAPKAAESAPVQVAPAPVTTPALAPAAGHGIGDVSAIRIADHPNMTRVVLDMNAKFSGAVKIENNGRSLIIDMSKMNWLGPKTWDGESEQLISGYHAEGGNLSVDLMYASQIKSQSVLWPKGGNTNYRLVIDLYSPEVHK